jgi:predicted nucleotidyltransferase
MLSTEEILLFLKENKPFLLHKFHCNEIGLFGSFARNEQSEKSDIDILVQFEKDAPDLYNLELELKEFLKNKFNREVDICSKKWIKPIFKPLVLNDAIYA